ncbi:hypothetical protein VOLCADRAFT_116901, partial [Volvox carteri f. nagariensis]
RKALREVLSLGFLSSLLDLALESKSDAFDPAAAAVSAAPVVGVVAVASKADVPSVRWDAVDAAGPEAGRRLRQMGSAPGRGANGQRPIHSLLRVRVDGTAGGADRQSILEKDREQLRTWALGVLRELHANVTLEELHAALLRNAVQCGAVPAREGAAWFKLYPYINNDDIVVRSRQLLAVLMHSSRSSQEAWAAVTQAFLHSLVQPDNEAARVMAEMWSGGEAHGSQAFEVTPESYQSYVRNLQDKMDQLLGGLLQEGLEDGGSPRAGRSLSEKDLAAYRLAMTPRSYLQAAGQKLLYHAALQIPCMAELPERIPNWTLRNLYGRPFAEAIKLALQHGMAAIKEAFGPSGEGPDERVRGGKLAHSLLQSGRKDGPQKSQERQPPPLSKRAAAAAARLSCGWRTAAGGGNSGSADGTGGVGKGDACQRALSRARTAVEFFAEVERDIRGFKEGFTAIILKSSGAPGGALLRPGSYRGLQQQQQPLQPHCAIAYLSVLREDVAWAFREWSSSLRTFLYGSVTSAVQACLADDDLNQPVGAVPLSPVTWPMLADVRLIPDCPSTTQVLEFASWLLSRLPELPETLQPVLAGAVVECLSMLMDRLSLVCTSLTDMPGSRPLSLLLLFHSAACCVRRRLEAMQPGLGGTAATAMGYCPYDGGQDVDLARQHGEALVQADELVTSIQQHTVLAFMQAVYDVVLSSLDRTNWCAFRPEVMRGQSAGPAVRVWHSMLLRMLRAAAQHAAPDAAEWLLGQVLLESASCLTQRYLQVGPTVQMLREFVADAVHLTASVFLFCQPIPVRRRAHVPRGGDSGGGGWGGPATGHGVGWEAQLQDSATDGHDAMKVAFWLRLPFPTARALSEAARELLTRAALLHIPGRQLENIAREAGLLVTGPAKERPECAPSRPNAAAAAGVTVAGAAPTLPARTGTTGDEAASAASAMMGSTDPWVANSAGAAAAAAGVVNLAAASDEERLALWTTWLPSDVVRVLTDPGEAIGLRLGGVGGDGGSDAVDQLLIPLANRMADAAPEVRHASKEPEGPMWRACLEHLAQRANAEEVMLALARRHELHAAVGTEPPGYAESRPVKAKARLSEQTQAFALELQSNSPPADSCRSGFTLDPELRRFNTQLLETCCVAKPDARALLRVELLLGEVRRWLAARPCPAAATAVLYAAGDGLVHAEHAVRSVGLVRFWQPENASVFLALLQLYADVLVQATRAAHMNHRQQQQQRNPEDLKPAPQQQEREKGDAHQQQQQQQQQQQRQSSCSDVVVLASDQEQQQRQQQQARGLAAEKLIPQLSEVSMECGESALQPGRSPQPKQHQQVPLTFAAAALLLRPDWLDMLAEALELLHFNEEFRLAAARAGWEPQEALSKALQLWCFLTQLVRFAAAHADSVKRMEPCLQRLGALLAPPSGTVPHLLDLPLAEDTLVAQLHALWLLQVLYDMPDAKVLYSAQLAEYYVALHHNAMVQSYEASAADPKSAAAELCRIHATLLRSLARHPGAPVRNAFARVKTVDWILEELSLECQLLPAAQQDGEAEDPDSEDSSSDSDITVTDDEDAATGGGIGGSGDGNGEVAAEQSLPSCSARTRLLSPVAPTEADLQEKEAAVAAGSCPAAEAEASRKESKGFSFTYDLNEDVERLIALEDELGREMELDGLDYDDEGKQLKARSDARMAEALAAEAAAAAEAATAAAAAEAGELQPASPAPVGEYSPGAQALQQQQMQAGPRDLQSHGSFGASSRPSGSIPRLALVGLRSVSISSLAAQSPAGKRPSGHGARASRTGNSSGVLSVHEGEDGAGEEPLSGDACCTPSISAAATAAERVAAWSSNLMDAYAAANAGDDSKLPYPPPRRRSRGSGSLDRGSSPAAPQTPPWDGDTINEQPPPPPHQQQQQQQQQQQDDQLQPATGEAGAVVPASAADEPIMAGPVRPRELTSGCPIHPGPLGELHLMVHTTGTGRTTQPSSTTSVAHGRPPLPTKPSLPPLRMVFGASTEAGTAATAPAAPVSSSSPSVSARAHPPGSSRAMVLLSASNRVNNAGLHAASPNAASQQQHQAQQGQAPWAQGPHSTMVALGASPIRDTSRQFYASNEGCSSSTTSAPPQPPSDRPTQPLIPALNLKSLRRRDGGGGSTAPPTDTGRTVPLSSMLRFTNAGSLSNCSGRDSANTLLRSGGTATTPVSSNINAHTHSHGASNLGNGLVASGALRRITETEQKPPEATYQELACQRLLYQDRATHILLLKVVVDLLVAPTATLDPAYVPQYPVHSGVPHAEFILLWHLNAPRNAGVVHDLCRGAQHRARQAAATAVRRAAEAAAAAVSSQPLGRSPRLSDPASSELTTTTTQQGPSDSARDYSPSLNNAATSHQSSSPLSVGRTAPAGPAAAPSGATPRADVAAPTRAGAVTRTLQLLSRPLFDASRYTNLQFVARGTFGDIYRARMEPPRALAWPSPVSQGEAAAAVAAAAAPMQVVIKTIQLPSSSHDPCVLADVFGEVSVMERFRGHECICQLLDYGMHNDAYWLVMRRYRCSLAEWRGRQKPLDEPAAAAAAAAAARVYLSALSQVVDALRLLASHHVVHFDLKCSNVLIEPLPGIRDGELWAPAGGSSSTSNNTNSSTGGNSDSSSTGSSTQHRAPFRCVLADFGEARAYRCAEEAFTARNRGTEVFKSPEMLLLNAVGSRANGAAKSTAPPPPQPWTQPPATAAATAQESAPRSPSRSATGGDGAPAPSSPTATARATIKMTSSMGTAEDAKRTTRQGLAGAGLASDVWSLGCLAYELLSGTVLFGGDYASVTHRVAFGTGEHLTLTEVERGRLANLQELVGLVEWILVRDPAKRPSLDRIAERIEQVRAALAANGLLA